MPEENPVNELISIERENQKLLGQLLASQEELIAVTRSQRDQGRWKLVFEGAKLIMWPLILVISFYFSMQLIKDFSEKFAENTNPSNLIESLRGQTNPETGEASQINEILNLLR